MKKINYTTLLIFYFIVYFLSLFIFGYSKPLWGDENHFVETIKQFSSKPFLEILYNYEEMSTPLPFIMYSIWGKLFGFKLLTLRFFSILIGIVFYFSLYSLFRKIFNAKKSLIYTVFLSINPYLAGFSFFVFTDMLALLFSVFILIAYQNKNRYLLSISISGALLCRQYFVFLPITLFIVFALGLIYQDKKNAILDLSATLSGIIPPILLFIFWGGLTPVNLSKLDYVNESLVFHASAVGSLFR